MVATTIEQILASVENFEQLLSQFYAKLSDQSHQDAVQRMLEYISRHRRRTKEALSKLPPEQLKQILKAPLRYKPHIPGVHCLDEINLAPDAGPREVLEAAIGFDECLMEMYRQIIRQMVHRDIKDMFESLLESEQNDQLELKKIEEAFA